MEWIKMVDVSIYHVIFFQQLNLAIQAERDRIGK
jgi:hypothetical protein